MREALVILGLLVLNGFFASAETALVSARRGRLKALAHRHGATLFTALKWLGGGYLVWLGVNAWRHAGQGVKLADAGAAPGSLRSPCCADPMCSTPRSRVHRSPSGASTTRTTQSAISATRQSMPSPTSVQAC